MTFRVRSREPWGCSQSHLINLLNKLRLGLGHSLLLGATSVGEGIAQVQSAGSHLLLRWLLVELVKVSLFLIELALADNATRKRLHPLQTPRLMWARQDDGELCSVYANRDDSAVSAFL